MKKLVRHEELLEECFAGLVDRLRQLLPGFGHKLAVDSTDLKAYSNGHRKNPSDPDARWGAKGVSSDAAKKKRGKERELYYWFGYKLHLAVDGLYELPVSYEVTPANRSDTEQMKTLLEKGCQLSPGLGLRLLLPIRDTTVGRTTGWCMENMERHPSSP
jgi:hypothetical protein